MVLSFRRFKLTTLQQEKDITAFHITGRWHMADVGHIFACGRQISHKAVKEAEELVLQVEILCAPLLYRLSVKKV
jgi:Ser-tRNA(Ala) deacylase AlaX